MKRFQHILQPVVLRKGENNCADFASVGNSQRDLGEGLFRLLAQSHLQCWTPGDPVTNEGRRVLVGVAPWSRYDLQLLDALNEAAASAAFGSDRVQIFDFSGECKEQADLERFIPGLDIRSVFHPPVLGIWEEGVLVCKASGAAARNLLTERYRLVINK